MAKYKDKWKTTFPTSIGNQTRPEDGVDNTQEYNTDGLPQYMANDPVRYDLQNAVNSQLVSNDERLNEKIKRTSDDLAAHNKDPKAHATGIAGNSATATKLATARAINLTGKAAGSTTFDGSANAAINVTSVNADTASKLSTARKINITGNASGSASFDGSSDININTTVNESKHAAAADVAKTLETTDANGVKSNGQFYWVGKDGQPMWLWGSNTKPSETYVYNPSNFHVAAANNDGDGANIANTYLKKSGGNMTGALNFANATWNLVGDDSYMGDHNIGGTFCIKGANDNSGIALINVNNEADYARISYGGGNINFNKKIAANLAGNADTATNATHASNADSATKIVNNGNRNNIANGAKPPSGLSVYQCYTHAGYPQQYGNVISIGGTGDNELFLGWQADARLLYRSKVDIQNNWTNWRAIAFTDEINNYAPTKTGGGASGTWNISINGGAKYATQAGNAASATNADKLDGYHASDLLRHLGGNQTPVITDIFDRAGTIDMTTMSAADKATHKANINKARNATQNIWNTDTGIAAYGGDYDMANGYGHGSLKLTQSYKNFDKILVVGANDNGKLLIYKLWDVWALANAFAGGSRFQLFHGGAYWFLYGSTRKGTWAGYVLSTDTVWSCQDQNSGIVAIYGIKY